MGTSSCISMVAFSSFILLTATCQCTAVQMECIVAFPWQQWLCEHTKIFCYTYIADLVLKWHQNPITACILSSRRLYVGLGVALWLRRCTTSWTVLGSFTGGVTGFFRPYHGPGVDSAPSENEYQEHLLGIKVAAAWGWWPHHLHMPKDMKSGSLNLLEPYGPHRACYGTALPVH